VSLKIIISDSDNPYKNLALEDLVLRDEKFVSSGDDYLILYINRPCLVLGNFQCLWKEIPWEARQKYNLDIVRRQSGGGTVYHDYGNLNFSFIFDKDKYPKNGQSPKLIKYFGELGIKVESSGRDDFGVKLNETGTSVFYKFSGQAFKQTRDRTLHHGTLLFNSQLETLNELCMPNLKVKSKSVDSVVSKVTNLIDLLSDEKELAETEDLRNGLAAYLVKTEDALIENTIVENNQNTIQQKVEQLTSWEIVFGKTPNFEFPFIYNTEEIVFEIKKAVITNVSFNQPVRYQQFFQNLVGLPLKHSDFERYVSQNQNDNSSEFVNLITVLRTQLFFS
jgi:lipoate-protein ligase A